MIEFKPYESKPITRMAFQITVDHAIIKSIKVEAQYSIITCEEPDNCTDTQIFQRVDFKAYEEPKIGDWVVRLTEDDTYHVTDAVFRERNIVL